MLVIFKATRRSLARLEALVLEAHPYDTPEIVFMPVNSATGKHLRWWQAAIE